MSEEFIGTHERKKLFLLNVYFPKVYSKILIEEWKNKHNKFILSFLKKQEIENELFEKLVSSLFQLQNYSDEINELKSASSIFLNLYFEKRITPANLSLDQTNNWIINIQKFEIEEKMSINFLQSIFVKNRDNFYKSIINLLEIKIISNKSFHFLALICSEFYGQKEENKTEMLLILNQLFPKINTKEDNLFIYDKKNINIFLKIIVEILQNEKIFHLLKENNSLNNFWDIVNKMISASSIIKENSKIIQLITTIQEIKQNQKITFDSNFATKINSSLESVTLNSELEETLKLLIILLRDGNYAMRFFKEGGLSNFLLNVKLENSNQIFLYFETVFLITLQTQEDRLAIIRENYGIDNNEKESLEKYLKMGNNTGLSTVSETDLNDFYFYQKLQEKRRIDLLIFKFLNEKKESGPFFERNLFQFLTRLLRKQKTFGSFYNESIIFDHFRYMKSFWETNENKIFTEGFFPFACVFINGIEISQIKYQNLVVLIDLLCSGFKNSEKDLNTFESLLGLTRILGEQPSEALRVWENNKIKYHLIEQFYSDNFMIRCSSLELFLNCIVSENVFEKFMLENELKSKFLQSISALILFFVSEKKIEGKISFGTQVYLAHILIKIVEYLSFSNDNNLNAFKTEIGNEQWINFLEKFSENQSDQKRLQDLLGN